MIKINLLPFRAARKKENIRRQISIFVGSLIFIFLLLIYFVISFSAEASRLKETDKGLKAKLATQEKVEKEIKQMEKDIAEIEGKLNVIKELDAKKTGPVHLLDEIAIAVPKDKLWLNSLSETGNALVLKGVAMDNETVALFMSNLEKSKMIASVQLESTRGRDIAKYNLRVSDFTLSCKTSASR
jgi:type IV pilus assembly protein PilN